MKSPITDKTLCIQKGWGQERFRDVRKRAKDDEVARTQHKRRGKKDKSEKEPKHKIDDKVVLVYGFSTRRYFLVEVIDYNPITEHYFGILRNTTDPEYFEKMIGHLIQFGSWEYHEANVPPESIKWERFREDEKKGVYNVY